MKKTAAIDACGGPIGADVRGRGRVRQHDANHHAETCSTAQKRMPEIFIAPPKSASAARVIGLSSEVQQQSQQHLEVERDREELPGAVVRQAPRPARPRRRRSPGRSPPGRRE